MPVDPLVLAYTAGLFDGEGSIVIGCARPPRAGGRVGIRYWLQVGVTNTDRELVEWLLSTYGGHISDNSHANGRAGWQPCWAWRVMSRQARIFLLDIQPYLRVKKAQAGLGIEFQEVLMRHGPSRAGYGQDAIAVRESYRQRLRELTFGSQRKPPVPRQPQAGA
jgi:hypothetical protein